MKYTQQEVQKNCITALKQIYDPEISVNIYDLGLIYELLVKEEVVDTEQETYDVSVKMTMTSPMCPLADDLVRETESALKETPGVGEVKIELVFDPPWDESRMSDEAKLELGLM